MYVLYNIITTTTALEEWKDRTEDLSRIGEFKAVPEDYLISLEKMCRLLLGIVDKLEEETISILDCTPLTKVYTIAIFNIAIKGSLSNLHLRSKEKIDIHTELRIIGLEEPMIISLVMCL